MKISVVLEALTGSFVTDMDRAAKEAKKRADETKKAWVDAAKGLGVAVGAGVSIAATALVSWTKQTVESARQIERLAKIAGTSQTEFQRWAAGARQAGIEQDKLADQLKDVQDKVGDFLQTGAGPMADFFKNIAPAVGVTADQFKNLSGPQALQLYVSSLEKANLSQNEMAFFMEAIASDTTALIPLLRNGGEGMKKYGDEAQRLGAIMSDDVISGTKELQEITRQMDAQWTSFKTNIVAEILPTITELAEKINSPAFQEGFAAMIKGAVEAAAELAGLVVEAGNVARWAGEEAAARINGPAADDIVRIEQAIERLKADRAELVELSKIPVAVDLGAGGKIAEVDAELAKLSAQLLDARKAQEDAANGAEEHRKKLEEQAAAAAKAAAEARNRGAGIRAQTELDRIAAEAAKEQAAQIAEANRELDRWAASLLPEAERAAAEYLIRQEEITEEFDDGRLTIEQYDRKLELLTAEYGMNSKEIARNAAEQEKHRNVLAQIRAAYAQQAAILGMTDQEARVFVGTLQAIEQWEQANGRAIDATTEAMLRQAVVSGEAMVQAGEEARRAAEESQRAWEDFAYGLADAVLDGSDGVKRYFKQLLDDLKRELIASGLLSLFRGIFNVGGAGTAGAGSLLGAMFNGAGGGGSGLLGSIFGGGGTGGAGMFGSILGGMQGVGGNGLIGSVLGAVGSWLGIGAGAAGPSLMAGLSAMPGAAGFAGVGAGAATSAGLLSGSGLSTAFAGVPIIGWIAAAAAMNQSLFAQGWRAGGGTLTLPDGQQVRGGSGSNALGNILTAGAVTGLDRALRGLGLSDSVASLLSGSSIHARLFGRKAPELTGQTTTYNLGEDGVSGSNLYRILERGGVFRSDRRSTRTGALSDEAAEAAQALYDSVRQVMIDSARALEGEAPAMLESALRVVQEFDKKGKVKSTKYFVDILGRTWEEATEEAATQRIAAEAMIATIDGILGTTVEAASQSAATAAGDVVNSAAEGAAGALGTVGDVLVKTMAGVQGEASAIAERWREDAAQLADGAQMLLAAAVDIRAGNALLGEGGTLTQVADLIEDLQAPGEALAATYQRVSASAALFDEALALSGVEIDKTREEIVRLAVDIADAAGGLDRAQQLWSAYFQSFFSEAERAEYARRQAESRASSQLGDIGLDLTQFSGAGGLQAFRDLFEGQMATLSAEAYVEWLEAAEALAAFVRLSGEAGGAVAAVGGSLEELMGSIKEQLGAFAPPPSFAQQLQAIGFEIAALIQRATELGASEQQLAAIRELGAARVNAVLEAQAEAYANYADIVRGVTDELADARGLTDFQRELRDIDRWLAQTTAAMNEAARAAGMQGAAEADLAAAHELAAIRAAEAIARLQERGRSVVDELYGSPLEQLEAQIAAIESGIGGFAGGVAGGMEQVQQATEGAINAQIGAQERIREWLDNLLIGDLGGLRPRDQLREAQALFDATLAAALGGDADAMGQLPQLADQLLRLGQRVYASGDPYFELRDSIRSALEQVAALPAVTPEPGGGQSGGGGGGGPNTWAGGSGTDLEALYAERERLLGEQAAAERRELATELMAIVRDLIIATGEPLETIAEQLGFSMGDLIADMGVNLDDLTAATAGRLADIAQAMGVELTGLAQSLGVDLGQLADRQSLLNDALEAEIAGLPEGQRAALESLLRDVEEAAALGDTAGVEAGISDMEDAIAEMAPEIRDLLAPYFTGIRPADPATELSHLSAMETTLGSSLAELQAQTLSLANIEGLLNGGGGLPLQPTGPLEPGGGFGGNPPPGYAVGTPWVPQDGLAFLHRGEAVIPASVNAAMRSAGVPAGTSDNLLLAEMREVNRKLDEGNADRRRMEQRIQQLEATTARGNADKVRAMERQTDAMRAR